MVEGILSSRLVAKHTEHPYNVNVNINSRTIDGCFLVLLISSPWYFNTQVFKGSFPPSGGDGYFRSCMKSPWLLLSSSLWS